MARNPGVISRLKTKLMVPTANTLHDPQHTTGARQVESLSSRLPRIFPEFLSAEARQPA
jgi:hypothetical protein